MATAMTGKGPWALKRLNLINKVKDHGVIVLEKAKCQRCKVAETQCIRHEHVSKKCLSCVRSSKKCVIADPAALQRQQATKHHQELEKRHLALTHKETQMVGELANIRAQKSALEQELFYSLPQLDQSLDGSATVLDAVGYNVLESMNEGMAVDDWERSRLDFKNFFAGTAGQFGGYF
jgi:hypothetical protein